MVRCYRLMSKAGNGVIQSRRPEQKPPQYGQKPRTVYINKKRQLRMCHIYNKHALFFVPSSINCVFLIDRLPPTVRAGPHQPRGKHSVLAVATSSAMRLTSPLVWRRSVAITPTAQHLWPTFRVVWCLWTPVIHPNFAPSLNVEVDELFWITGFSMNAENKLLPTDGSTCTCWIAKMKKCFVRDFFFCGNREKCCHSLKIIHGLNKIVLPGRAWPV